MFLLYLAGILLTIVMGTPADTDGTFAFCLEHVVCKAKGGIPKAAFCAEKMVKSDKEFLFEKFSDYYPEDATSFNTLLKKTCEDGERGKEASMHYYEERIKNERISNHTFEEKKGLAEARACIMFMVEDCERKKSMGML